MRTELVIEEMSELINSVLSKNIEKSTAFPMPFTCYQVLERVKFNLNSLKLLFADSIVNHDHAIGLILRNLLSDFIITGFIIRLSIDRDDQESNLYSLYYSDLKKVDALLKLYKDHKYINDDDLNAYNNRYSDNNHIYNEIQDYCIKHKVKSFPLYVFKPKWTNA